MASHVSHCMVRAYACRRHGKPCVWHVASHGSSCMALLNPINRGFQLSLCRSSISVRVGSSKEKEVEGKREREERRREGEERKGEREEKKRNGEKKREEEWGGREEKQRGKGRSVA